MNEHKELVNKKIENLLPYMVKETSSNITEDDLEKLNNWERNFLESIDHFLEGGASLTEKQLKKLQQIDDKLCKI